MKRVWLGALALMVPLVLYAAGLAHGRPRPEYSPSTVQHGWLNSQTVYHPDSFAYVGIPYRMLLNKTWNPHYYHNPSLTLNSNLLLFWLSGAADMPHDLDHGDREIAPFQLYVMGRWMSALYTLLTVVMSYAAGRVVFGRRAGLIAAALVAVSPLTTEYAHFAIPIAQTTMVSTAALLAALIIARERFPARLPRWVLYGIAGLLVGLTMSGRYNAVVIGLVPGVVIATRWWTDRRRWLPPVVAAVAVPVGFAVGTPGIVLATQEVVDQVREILDWYRVLGGGPGFNTDRGLSAYAHHWRYVALIAVGPVGVGAALLGLVAVFRRMGTRGWRWLTGDGGIAALLVLYMLVYTALALPGKRLNANLLPPLIVPLALLAGVGLARLDLRWRWIAAGVVLIWPLVLSALFAYRVAVPDTRMRAQEWVYAHVPRGSSVYLLGPYNVPLDPLDYTIRQTYAREAGPADVQQSDAQIIVYSDAFPWSVFRDPSLSPQDAIDREEGIRDVLRSDWIELKHFDRMPWPGERIAPDDVSYWFQMAITIYCNPADCPVDTGD